MELSPRSRADISVPLQERPHILRSQDLATCPFPQPDQSNPNASIPFYEDWW